MIRCLETISLVHGPDPLVNVNTGKQAQMGGDEVTIVGLCLDDTPQVGRVPLQSVQCGPVLTRGHVMPTSPSAGQDVPWGS